MADESDQPKQVFVSHSRNDIEGQNFLRAIFDAPSSRFKPFFYGVFDTKPPHAETLRKHIRKSEAIFVLLSPEMRQPWTRGWIGYEVGIASQLGLPVVVVEPKHQAPIDIPVPCTTHYILREKLPKNLMGTFWLVVSRTACIEPPPQPKEEPVGFWPNVADALLTVLAEDLVLDGYFQRSTCRHSDCRAEFFTPKEIHDGKFFCPVCRRETWGLLAELYDYAAKQNDRI